MTKALRVGMMVYIKGRVLTPPRSDGWFNVDINDTPYRFNLANIGFTDPRPYAPGDVVRSTLVHRDERTGVVQWADSETNKVLVRWDDGQLLVEHSNQLKSIGPDFATKAARLELVK